MRNGFPRLVAVTLAVVLLLAAQPSLLPVVAYGNTVVVGAYPQIVLWGQGNAVTVSGTVSVASGSVAGTSVLVEISRSNGSIVESASAPVSGTDGWGTYSLDFSTAAAPPPQPQWTPGNYVVNGTYDAGGTLTSSSATFTIEYCPETLTTAIVAPAGNLMLSPIGMPVVYQDFVSHSSCPHLPVYLWVAVQNSEGQTVGVFLGSATLSPNATAQIGAALFNLPSGRYTATAFLALYSNVVVSVTSTSRPFTI
jgi:hypothetical protein